jgi:hypothetical protein
MGMAKQMKTLAEGQAEVGIEYLVRAARAIRLDPSTQDIQKLGFGLGVWACAPNDMVEVVVKPEGTIELTVEFAFDPDWRPIHTHEPWDDELGLGVAEEVGQA